MELVRVTGALFVLVVVSGCGTWTEVTPQDVRTGRVRLEDEVVRVTYPARSYVLRRPRGVAHAVSGIDEHGEVVSLDLRTATLVRHVPDGDDGTLLVAYGPRTLRLDVEEAALPLLSGRGHGGDVARGEWATVDLTHAERVERYQSRAIALAGAIAGAAVGVTLFAMVVLPSQWSVDMY